MSEDQELDPRTEADIQAALEALESGVPPEAGERCAYLETLGLLAYEIDEVRPAPAVKRTLVSRVSGRGATPPASPSEKRSSVAGSSPRPVWMLRVAAVLAVALLGLSALQYAELGRQREEIRRQEDRIAELRQDLAELGSGAEAAPAWLATSGTELCELEPARTGTAADSKGWLFVRQDHQHWYVSLEGLAPAPPDHVYELWFVVDGDLVSSGTFQPDPDGRAILASPTMPSGVSGIAVTLEPANGDDVPSEEMILYGDEVMLVL
ncbi:MAG: anti-sigma factor [Thermoanaerobaculia bacterium]|nr:anti-sigma factor [Thermoanaerobaculia bacterium]